MLSTMMQCAGRIRVKDCPFGAPDGVASQFQIVYRHGHPVTKDVRIASIHQTDWQGRVELSDQPRTNAFSDSAVSDILIGATDSDHAWRSADAIETSPGDTAPNGVGNWLNFAITGSDSAHFIAQPIVVEAGQHWYIRWYTLGSGTSLRAVYDATNGAWVVAPVSYLLADNAQLMEFDVPAGCTLARVYILRGASSGSVWGAQASLDSSPVYIPTPSGSTVTVTDYTHDGSGGITTGQVPDDGADLDWTGTARRAA